MTSPFSRNTSLLFRVAKESDRALRKLCSEWMAEVASGRTLPPAAVWIVDNYAFLHAQLREVREAIPPGYEKHLARLSGGLIWGRPRMYLVAFEAISRIGDELTQESLCEFLELYQFENQVKLAELWALGPLLKLALVQKACLAVQQGPLDSAACEEAVRVSINSLRNLETTPWSEVVEATAPVERTLRRDPAGVYEAMDRKTREGYRRSVEGIAKRSGWTEREVAAAAVELAATAEGRSRKHVGFYLIGRGREELKARTGYRPGVRESLWHWIYSHPNLCYLGGMTAATAAVVAAASWWLAPAPWWFLLLLILPASQTAQAVTNLLINFFLGPRRLSRMDFSEGIPSECRTFVVVPALLISRAEVRRLLERLEIHYLANRDRNLLFGLLTDFPDCPGPHGDEDLLNSCAEQIRALNRRHGVDGSGPFYLFHRPLRWSDGENVWMGHERKRGKLNDFNALLLGEGDAFSTKAGDLSLLPSVRYVITLDSDTQLPRDAARELVATIAHPLNHPEVDPRTNTVREGYALLQPRVSISMESAGRSRLARIHSGQTGFDPYATAVSDVYQDLHAQGSFTGKGIYDVAVFHRVAGPRFPENTLLSHDLIEGEHARVGLVTDVEVIDDFPSTYESFSKRKHRWVRGDWQILDWLFRSVPSSEGKVENPLGLLSRWKIFDNLRRSLLELGLLALLLAGWAFIPDNRLGVSLAALALLLAPAYADTALSLMRFPPPRFWGAFVRELASRLSRAHLDTLLNLIFLPHQALLMADAVGRTLIRKFITHRRLLQWQTMAQAEAEKGSAADLMSLYLLASPAIALAAAIMVLTGESDLLTALFLELWVAAPLVALWVNAKPRQAATRAGDDAAYLRSVCLRTWRYFVDFGGPEENWIVPDNVQQDPPARALRTSPTNLGMQAAANLAAHDLGYITHQELGMRLDQLFGSMRRMKRFKGHFYNWYDTASLAPLEPLFVSTVDSGNLAASLIAVKQFCLRAGREPLIDRRTLEGLRDHCARLRDALPGDARSSSVMRPVAALEKQLAFEPSDLFCWESLLSEVAALVERLREPVSRAASYLEERHAPAADEVRYWFHALAERVETATADLYALAPWLDEPYEPALRLYTQSPDMAELISALSRIPRLSDMPAHYAGIAEKIRRRLAADAPLHPAARTVLADLTGELEPAADLARRVLREFQDQAEIASAWVMEMDFEFLFDRRRKLLHIGYDAVADRPDESFYDLLASEARSAVFLAIAKGDIPREAWFHLGRRLTSCQGQSTLVSWSGTMFEYLMPQLFMKTYSGTLLAESLEAVVRIQQRLGRQRSVPWGISEAACSLRDHAMIYQYEPFGIAELSANPALSSDLVIAPYATMLSSMVDRAAASANLRRMEADGWTGRYGFYESIDYTSRPGGGSIPSVVRAFMVHHQGMGLVALTNALLDGRMRERFHREPMVLATEYLLQERLPALLEVTDEQQRLSLEFRLPAAAAAKEAA